MKPRRWICDQTDTLPAASAVELVPNVLGFLSFGAYQRRREGDPDAWATQVLHIICPGLHPGEDTPASPHGVDTTQPSHVPSVIGTATPKLVFTATTDAAKWVQIYGLLRPTDANEYI